jgi:hypothetical protein
LFSGEVLRSRRSLRMTEWRALSLNDVEIALSLRFSQ